MLNWWLPENVTSYGVEIDWLFQLIYAITGITAILVFGTMIAFLIMYRDRPGRKATYTHGNTTLEIVWTIVPTLILVVLTFLSLPAWSRIKMEIPAGDVVLASVKVGADALLGREGEALALIEEATDFATALICAEAVGAMKFACDTTLEYLKTRKQFGVPIGTFQALQHRMVDMFVSYEQAKSMACLAASKADGATDAKDRARAISAAKIKIADNCRHISQESVQLHGGMGMAEELKVSHAFRRLTVIAQQFGDAEHHLARFAALDSGSA